mgnify:CR=1 FL=1
MDIFVLSGPRCDHWGLHRVWDDQEWAATDDVTLIRGNIASNSDPWHYFYYINLQSRGMLSLRGLVFIVSLDLSSRDSFRGAIECLDKWFGVMKTKIKDASLKFNSTLGHEGRSRNLYLRYMFVIFTASSRFWFRLFTVVYLCKALVNTNSELMIAVKMTQHFWRELLSSAENHEWKSQQEWQIRIRSLCFVRLANEKLGKSREEA